MNGLFRVSNCIVDELDDDGNERGFQLEKEMGNGIE